MQTSISYLQKPKKRLNERQIYLRMQAIPGMEAELDRPEEPADGPQGTHITTNLHAGAPPSAKGKAVVKWLYRWLARTVLFALLLLLASLIMYLRPPATHGGIVQEMAPASHTTAKTSYAIARPIALGWAADSQLISLSATWDPGDNLHDGEGDWSLLFYSPSRVSTALVSVVDGQATLIDSHGIPKIEQNLQTDLWQIDSPTVVGQMKASGGAEFLRGQPNATLVLSLNLIGEATWKARLIHQESRRVFSAQINIDDGQIIEVHQSE